MRSQLVLWRLALGCWILAALAAGVASAQTIDFRLTASENGQTATIANGASLPFSTAVGTSVTATVTATYIGGSVATISQPLQYLGSNEFTVTSNLTTLPETFNPFQSFTMTIIYTPTTSAQANGQITVTYTEPGSGTNATPVTSQIVINLVGTSPAYTLSYVLETTKNGSVIPSGGQIPFGPTPINTPALADLTITDTGSGPGAIIGITQPPAGSPFVVQGIPPLSPTVPYALIPGSGCGCLTLLVQYTPTAVENDTASIQITSLGGVTETVVFTGNGVTSTFTYKVLIQGSPATTVSPGGTITFPGANLGSSSSLILTVANSGSASGTINSISTNAPFSIASPITLPVQLTTGNSVSVPLTFTPTQVGTQTGYLVIGNATFTLSGKGLGANLTYAYTSSAGTNAVNLPNGAVLFSTIPVGQSEKVTFTITNSGTSPATISLVGTSSANGEFTVPTIPAQTLGPGQPLSFPITFTPTVTGLSSGTLMVNSTAISLEGNATTPAPLPSYTITGPSGTTAPETQANVSLTLSKPYTLDLNGTFTLSTEGNFGTDPAVQFATGSTTGNRTVDFTIPAGSTSADFAGQGSEIGVQTGTVAETVILTPTFATAGGADVTPASTTTLQFTIPSEAPFLQLAQIGNESDNSFQLVLTGYSTTRSLSSLNVTFTATTGFNIQTTLPAIDISQASAAWFASAASEAFGGLFQITETFILQGTVKANQTLIESIASVTATVSNSIGTSNSASATVQ
jgi:Abnormal spindle-like microcephaly-assoc'd, ASPM-SPD-2-Hydin